MKYLVGSYLTRLKDAVIVEADSPGQAAQQGAEQIWSSDKASSVRVRKTRTVVVFNPEDGTVKEFKATAPPMAEWSWAPLYPDAELEVDDDEDEVKDER